MFEVYGGESESMSDQYIFFYPFIKHIAFSRMTAFMLTFLVVSACATVCVRVGACVCVCVYAGCYHE